MNNPRRIGILGGMGPQATILLQQKLLDAVQAKDDHDHIPLIVDMNPQVPSRIEHLIHKRGRDPAPVLADMARGLQAAGALALAMPCNTAHYYSDAIRGAVSVPFLDMVELAAVKAVEELGQGGRVGILASPAVQMTGLFDTALTKKGLTTVWPDNSAKMLRAIQVVKAQGPSPEACEIFAAASSELADSGASFQLVACSEFSLLVDNIAPDTQAVDTLDVLVAAIREFSFNSPGTLELKK
jgi:aspartate racemase